MFKVSKKLLIIGVILLVLITLFLTVGMKYMDTPSFCGKCHVMDDVVASHKETVHKDLNCNDCHMPEGNIIEHLIFKGKVGSGHVYYNTFARDEIPTPIKAKEETKDIIQENCIRCHSKVVSDVDHDAKDHCVDCHRTLPHE